MEPIANPFFANFVFHQLDTPKFDPRGTLRIPGLHARTNGFLDQHFEVGMNLLVEVYFHMTNKKRLWPEPR